MIGGAVYGAGGSALGRHNASVVINDDVRLGQSRGLMADGIEEQISELTDLARASGHKSPIRHVYASPPPDADWENKEWESYWALYEKAQGLEGCPFSEAIHDKPGDHNRPEHRHRVYLAITTRGTLVRTGNDYPKQEAVSRITEFDTGAPFTKGKHNVRAERMARQLGRDDVADAMIAAGLLDGTSAVADLSPNARAQQDRTGIKKVDVAESVAAAWAGVNLSDLPAVADTRASVQEAAKSAAGHSLYIDNGQLGPPKADPSLGGGRPTYVHHTTPASPNGAPPASAPPSPSLPPDIGFHADTLDGPGEPHGSGAGPVEIARYRLNWLSMKKSVGLSG